LKAGLQIWVKASRYIVNIILTSSVATNNGKSDYAVVKAPATWANGNFGHGQVNVKRAAAIIAWMNWQAKGNQTAGKHFFEPNDPFWKQNSYTEVKYKNFGKNGLAGAAGAAGAADVAEAAEAALPSAVPKGPKGMPKGKGTTSPPDVVPPAVPAESAASPQEAPAADTADAAPVGDATAVE
jgi:hypothetical protein